jgi:iron complex outermembrane recepter protein
MLFRKGKFLFILLLMSAISELEAQSCNLAFSGRVLSAAHEPLAGASIMISPTDKGTVTNAEGEFTLTGLCKGTYRVSIQYLGYQTQTISLKLTSDERRDIKMETDLTQLNEVVVEGKIEHVENAKNFVQLNEKELTEAAGKSLGETLKGVSGVSSIQAGPGIFKPVIHGVHSQRILLLNHGIRQEGQQWGAEHAPEIDPFIASDIVVIKDASSIKYGADAIGGVVIVNPPPLPREAGLGGSIQTIAQSNGRSGTMAGTLEGGLKKLTGFGWRLQSSAKRSGDFHSPTYSLTNTGLKELNYSGAAGYHGDRGGVELFYSHFQTEVGILKGTSISNLQDLLAAMESEVPQNTTSFSYDIGEPRQEVSHDLLKINGHLETESAEWRIQYGFQNNQRREYDVRRGDLSKLPAIDLQLSTHSLEAEWESKANEKRSMCLGITGLYQDNNNVPGTQRIPFIPNFNSLSGGAFGIANFYWKNISLDFGARYDYKNYDVVGFDFKNSLYRNSLNFHNLSATGGIDISLGRGQSVSSSLSSAWRPPHVAELFSLGTHQSAAAIEYGLFLNDSTNEVMSREDVSFKNEKGLKWVNTYRYEKSLWKVELSGYMNYIFNYFYLRPTGITQNVRGVYPYFRYTQTDALFLGVDLAATWTVAPGLKVSPKVTYLNAHDAKNDDYLVFIPSNRAELGLRYERDRTMLKGIYMEAKVKYTAKQTRAPRVITIREFESAMQSNADPLNGSSKNFDFLQAPDGYTLVAISTGFSIPAKKSRYDFRASAENLLNTQYREYTNRFRYYADDLGRNFILSAKCIF